MAKTQRNDDDSDADDRPKVCFPSVELAHRRLHSAVAEPLSRLLLAIDVSSNSCLATACSERPALGRLSKNWCPVDETAHPFIFAPRQTRQRRADGCAEESEAKKVRCESSWFKVAKLFPLCAYVPTRKHSLVRARGRWRR